MSKITTYLLKLYFAYFVIIILMILSSIILHQGIKIIPRYIDSIIPLGFIISIFVIAHAISFIPFANIVAPEPKNPEDKKIPIIFCLLSVLIEAIGFIWIITGGFYQVHGKEEFALILFYFVFYLPGRIAFVFALWLFGHIIYFLLRKIRYYRK